MRFFAIGSVVAALTTLTLPATVGAGNVSRDVEKYTVSSDTLCGVSGTSYWVVNLTSGPTANGSSFIAGTLVQTFVADNGQSVRILWSAGAYQNGPTVYNSDGSSSFTAVESGLNVMTKAVGGPLLEQSTGTVTYTVSFDANGEFKSLVIDSTTGPENNITGEPDCSIIGPYLVGG